MSKLLKEALQRDLNTIVNPPDYSKWSLVELLRGTPSWTRVQREAKRKASRLTVNDLIVLRCCAETVLKTNKALKGKLRRQLRTAANRAKRHVRSI